MINKIISLLLALTFISTLPADSSPRRHFLAVFVGKKQFFKFAWERLHPDLMYLSETESFLDVPDFLTKAHKLAGKQDVDLDFDVHGEEWGLSTTRTPERDDQNASVGYLCNAIDKEFDPKHVTVFLEACYAGRAYANTIRDNNSTLSGSFYENHSGTPEYPIYGIGSGTPNFGNFIYCQYISGIKVSYEDLRRYETSPVDERIDNEADPRLLALFALWISILETR